jgi:hypothetical protein
MKILLMVRMIYIILSDFYFRMLQMKADWFLRELPSYSLAYQHILSLYRSEFQKKFYESEISKINHIFAFNHKSFSFGTCMVLENVEQSSFLNNQLSKCSIILLCTGLIFSRSNIITNSKYFRLKYVKFTFSCCQMICSVQLLSMLSFKHCRKISILI